MALGLPIIASDVGGINNLIEGGVSGLLFEFGNSSDLSEQIEKLLLDSSLRRTLADNAEKIALCKYTNHVMFENYNNLIANF